MYKLKYRMVENMILHQLLVKISRTSIYYNMQYNGYDFLAQYHLSYSCYNIFFSTLMIRVQTLCVNVKIEDILVYCWFT